MSIPSRGKSAHVDPFTRDHLPPLAQQPVYAFDLPELQFPPQVLISVVIGKEGARVPDGDTVLQPGDEVIAVIPYASDAEVRAMISGATEGA